MTYDAIRTNEQASDNMQKMSSDTVHDRRHEKQHERQHEKQCKANMSSC